MFLFMVWCVLVFIWWCRDIVGCMLLEVFGVGDWIVVMCCFFCVMLSFVCLVRLLLRLCVVSCVVKCRCWSGMWWMVLVWFVGFFIFIWDCLG